MTDYPKPSVTVDCVIFDGPNVLLIQRGDEPFKGRWALPGGFVNPDETVEAAAARELEEETGLKDVRLRLLGVHSKPGRDPRGWVISVAFWADVQDSDDIRIKAGDDAVAYQWVNPEACGPLAFDHDEILKLAELARLFR